MKQLINFATLVLCTMIYAQASQLKRLVDPKLATSILKSAQLNSPMCLAYSLLHTQRANLSQLNLQTLGKGSSSILLRHMSSSPKNWAKDTIGRKILPEAIAHNDLVFVQKFLTKNTDKLNARIYKDQTPLLFSLHKEQYGIASYLIEQGANPNIYDDCCETPLVKALQQSWLDGARKLLKKGANPNVETAFKSSMPLVQAAQMQDESLVKELFAHGANPQLVYDHIKILATKNKITPSMLALFEDKIQKKLPASTIKTSRYTFTDIAGDIPDDVKRLGNYLKDPKIRERYIQFNVQLPKGIMFHGPPGTGKTMLARAMADEANIPFIYVKISDILSKWVGESESKIAALFKEAKEMAAKNPKKTAILFFDELDAIGNSRKADSHSWEISKLNALLAEIDGFDPSTGLIIIGATNRPDFLDEALTRPGRFDTKIKIDLPSPEKQKDILKLYLNKTKYEHAQNPEGTVSLIETVLAKFKQSTLTVSPALLKNIIDEAARRTVETDSETVLDATILCVVDEHIKKNQIKGMHIL